MKLVTWNVNSLKARLPRVLEFLDEHAPDVLCMQETKCDDAAFPVDELAAAGYHAVHHSAGRWAGVAIVAREGLALSEPVAGLPGELRDDEARWIEATVDGVRVVSTYVPNGRAVGSPTFEEKLAFLDAIAARVGALRAETDAVPLAVAGDFNVAPSDLDVYDPDAFIGSTHVTPQERARIEAIVAAGGLVDALRALHPDDVAYTWWDYRQGHFHRKMGLRIDLVLVSQSLVPRLERVGIERTYRKGAKPSDHAPLVAELHPATT
ncbi:MAG: exodeoxyribonuclease III [Actinobacteria bacterium]|nr:exodeoxyribonuclease III [Actinomycetota bacterium]